MNKFVNTKPIRLIELFAGIGSQAKALKRLGIPFESHFVCDFDKYAVASYNAVHGTNYEPCDITKITATDLNIIHTHTNLHTCLHILSLVRIYLSQVKVQVWKKAVGHEADYCGKLKGCLMSAWSYRNFCLWKMLLRYTALKTKSISING